MVHRRGAARFVLGTRGGTTMDRLQGKRVLLVEDEPTIAVTLGDELAERGCAVACVADGAAAVALLAGGGFDAVVTDVRLPGADGREVVRAARRFVPAAPVLVITAAPPPWLQAADRGGADGVLTKPVPNDLVAAWLQQRWRAERSSA